MTDQSHSLSLVWQATYIRDTFFSDAITRSPFDATVDSSVLNRVDLFLGKASANGIARRTNLPRVKIVNVNVATMIGDMSLTNLELFLILQKSNS